MSNIQEVMRQKKSDALHVIGPSQTVLYAAKLMNQHKIGALVVTDDNKLTGILTERDVLLRVVAEQRDPACTPVGSVMTTGVVTCTACTPIETVRRLFKNHHVRHMPVVDDNQQLEGMISIGDLNAFDLADSVVVITALKSYLYGVA